MTRLQRTLFTSSMLFGVLLTLLIIAIDGSGSLAMLDRWFYDWRARHAQRYTPPPTDRVVHFSIDDAAIEAIGSWPWPRSAMGEIVDQLNAAGAKAIGLDVVFAEATPPTPEIEIQAGGVKVVAREVDHDQALADAMRRSGRVVLPVSCTFSREAQTSLAHERLFAELYLDLELTPEAAAGRLAAGGISAAEAAKLVDEQFIEVRRLAMYGRIGDELVKKSVPFEELRPALLPKLDRTISDSPLLRLMSAEHRRVQAVRSVSRFGHQIPMGLPSLLSAVGEVAPDAKFGDAALGAGFADYLPADDGSVRMIPLFVNYRGRLIPQFGLSLACAVLGVDLSNPGQARLDSDRLTLLPPDGRQIVVPLRTGRSASLGQPVGLCLDIPWFGGRDWQTMYDFPDWKEHKQQFSINAVWRLCQARRSIIANNRVIDQALQDLVQRVDAAKAEQFLRNPPAADDVETRDRRIAWSLDELKGLGWTDEDNQRKPEEAADAEERQLLAAVHAIRTAQRQNLALTSELARGRDDLKGVDGRGVFIGWSATGAAADFVPTPLHARCPGSVVHGVIFNAIITGEFWRTLPDWVIWIVTLLLGLIVTVLAAYFGPLKTLPMAVLLAAAFVLVNIYFLFDRNNLILGAAGPVLVIATVWAGSTLARFLVESAEREKVTRRFRSYVDPALVDLLLETTTAGQLESQLKELTVVFTDLAGFTAISEKLKEQAPRMIGLYNAMMVPIIRKHNGYVQGFTGDGIICFFGAPVDNPRHAHDAVAAVLEMGRTLPEFNQSLAKQGLPAVSMRAGVSSGKVVVGDAGPPEACNYTVLGDAVNLGARLESANKVTGTNVLISARTMELLAGEFLVRPVARLQVKGKSEHVMTYEPLALAERATDAQKELAAQSARIVDAFASGYFEGCMKLIERLEEIGGANAYTAFYRSYCESRLNIIPDDQFSGQIVLTEK